MGPPDATCSSSERGPRDRSGAAFGSGAASVADRFRPRPPRRRRRRDAGDASSSPSAVSATAAASGWASSRWLDGVCSSGAALPASAASASAAAAAASAASPAALALALSRTPGPSAGASVRTSVSRMGSGRSGSSTFVADRVAVASRTSSRHPVRAAPAASAAAPAPWLLRAVAVAPIWPSGHGPDPAPRRARSRAALLLRRDLTRGGFPRGVGGSLEDRREAAARRRLRRRRLGVAFHRYSLRSERGGDPDDDRTGVQA